MKLLKWIFLIVTVLVLALIGFGAVMSESEPESATGPEADQLAERMMDAVNHEAWENTRFVAWTFASSHHFVWDKEQDVVQVKWGSHEVLLNTKTIDGIAKKDNMKLSGDEKSDAIQTAWTHFCNDSFWLNAPTKAFDAGTERSVVTNKDGSKSLKVSYKSGGVTPGDSYLWFLDENGLPTSYKMWVSILPIKGIEATWENWTELSTGAKIAQTHKIYGLPIVEISNLKGGNTLDEIGVSSNPFDEVSLERQNQ